MFRVDKSTNRIIKLDASAFPISASVNEESFRSGYRG